MAWQRAHPAAHLAHALAYQARNRAAGLCAKCGHPAVPGRAHCAACAEKARARVAAYRERNKLAGLCVKCGRPAVPERTLCAGCAERQRAKDIARSRRDVAGGDPKPVALRLVGEAAPRDRRPSRPSDDRGGGRREEREQQRARAGHASRR